MAGVTLNRSLYERVLRDLLVERAEHTVELYEGSGASWTLARCRRQPEPNLGLGVEPCARLRVVHTGFGDIKQCHAIS